MGVNGAWSSQVIVASQVIIQGNPDGMFVYNGTPALGNLIVSAAAQAGTDPYGNAYPQGLNVTAGVISGVTFNGTNFFINPSGAFFYSGTPALGNLTTSIAPASGTDAFGNAFPEGITNYNRTSNTFVNMDAGQMLIGALIGGVADLTHASSINQSGGGLTLESGLHAGAGQDQGQIIAVSGPQNNPVTGGPLVTIKDTAGNSAVDLTISGPITSCDLVGNQNTWQTPGFAAGYTAGTIAQYRLDAFDNVVWDFMVVQTTGVAGSGGAVVTTAVPAAFRPKISRPLPCTWESTASVAKGSATMVFNTSGTISLLWPSTTANGDKFSISVSVPLGNIV